MAVISTADELVDSDVYIDLRQALDLNLYLRCEGFNLAGSVKLKAAVSMIDAAERDGLIGSGTTLVESSSGNLGIAISVAAAARSLRFVCVTDPKCNPRAIRMIRALGGTVVVVNDQDRSGSYLTARKAFVRDLCARNADHLWLNQYENPAHWLAHYEYTAPVIAKHFPTLDVLFVGAGTGGTLTGCARYFRDNGDRVRVVAVDSVGSLNLGFEAGPRHIPGLGASEPMPLVETSGVTQVVRVPEIDTIRTCRSLGRRGLLFGGSTGTVVTGATRWLAEHDPLGKLTAVAISPDFGDRYLDTVYDDDWVREKFGAEADADPVAVAGSAA